MLQTIASYEHSEDLWNDSLRAYVLTDRFPVSNTLAPISWVQPKDLEGFDKNLHAYFGENFAKEFKDGVTAKMNPSADERNYAAYMNVLQGLSHLTDTITTPNGDQMPYVQWMTDSTFNANTNAWVKGFKQYDSIWSKTSVDTIGMRIYDTMIIDKHREGNTIVYDTIYRTDTAYYTHPSLDSTVYVYPQIKQDVDSVWENHVTFYDLILGADGYSIEYQRNYYINAELRIYDEKGTYSKTDSKEIGIN